MVTSLGAMVSLPASAVTENWALTSLPLESTTDQWPSSLALVMVCV